MRGGERKPDQFGSRKFRVSQSFIRRGCVVWELRFSTIEHAAAANNRRSWLRKLIRANGVSEDRRTRKLAGRRRAAFSAALASAPVGVRVLAMRDGARDVGGRDDEGVSPSL